MGLFKALKRERHGVYALGVVDHVMVTAISEATTSTKGELDDYTIHYVTFTFTDQQGRTHSKEVKENSVHQKTLPAPGSRVEVQYMPDAPDNCNYYRVYPPDPSVPRGWGAGIFQPASDSKSAHALSRGKIDKQRDLFR